MFGIYIYIPWSFLPWRTICGIFPSSSFDDIAASIIEGYQLCLENHKLIISNILYRELLHNFQHINKPAFIKYFIFSTCVLSVQITLVTRTTSWVAISYSVRTQFREGISFRCLWVSRSPDTCRKRVAYNTPAILSLATGVSAGHWRADDDDDDYDDDYGGGGGLWRSYPWFNLRKNQHCSFRYVTAVANHSVALFQNWKRNFWLAGIETSDLPGTLSVKSLLPDRRRAVKGIKCSF